MLKKNLLSADAAVNAASAAAIVEIALTQVRTVRTRSIVHSPSILAAPNRTECVRCDLGHGTMRWGCQQLDLGLLRLWSNMSVRALKKYGNSLARCESLDA